jgi:DNA adenine methylase
MRFVREVTGGIPAMINSDPYYLYEISGRLLGVQFENKGAEEIIQSYDGLESLIYFDPPYIQSERTTMSQYLIEQGNDFHIAAASLLRACAGFVVVSGYACPLYTELYESHGWQRVDKEAQTNSGGKRIESLWLSPRTVEALNMLRQARML